MDTDLQDLHQEIGHIRDELLDKIETDLPMVELIRSQLEAWLKIIEYKSIITKYRGELEEHETYGE